jgi:exodeoxyribonuclease VII large subunit
MHPSARLAADRARLTDLSGRASALIQRRVTDGARRFGALAGRLEALSPLRVLERGYAIALVPGRDGAGHVITSASELTPGAPLTVRLHRGAIGCRVETVDARDS